MILTLSYPVWTYWKSINICPCVLKWKMTLLEVHHLLHNVKGVPWCCGGERSSLVCCMLGQVLVNNRSAFSSRLVSAKCNAEHNRSLSSCGIHIQEPFSVSGVILLSNSSLWWTFMTYYFIKPTYLMFCSYYYFFVVIVIFLCRARLWELPWVKKVFLIDSPHTLILSFLLYHYFFMVTFCCLWFFFFNCTLKTMCRCVFWGCWCTDAQAPRGWVADIPPLNCPVWSYYGSWATQICLFWIILFDSYWNVSDILLPQINTQLYSTYSLTWFSNLHDDWEGYAFCDSVVVDALLHAPRLLLIPACCFSNSSHVLWAVEREG